MAKKKGGAKRAKKASGTKRTKTAKDREDRARVAREGEAVGEEEERARSRAPRARWRRR
jgi:hypothetical protein